MRNTLRLLVALLLLQTAAIARAIMPWRGTMTPYNLNIIPAQVSDTLTPIGIIHIARHGARYITSPDGVEAMRNSLESARRRGTITALGERMMLVIDAVDSITDGRWGMLDSVGRVEERMLASGMRDRFPRLLRMGRISARATYVPRAIQSMYGFTYRLATLSPYLNITTHEGPREDTLLRFFDTDSLYVEYLAKGNWRDVYEQYAEKIVPRRPAVAMLGTQYPASDKELRDFAMQAYSMLRSLRAMGMEAHISPFFTDQELENCWRVSNLKHWLQRTQTPWSSLPATASMPLYDRLVADIESIATGTSPYHAMLYFGHAETLMPLFSLIDLGGCNAPECTPDQVWSHWQDWRIVPLGANIDIELYRGQSGCVYVSAVLNGHRQGASASLGSVETWQRVKQVWQARVNEISKNGVF